VRDKKILFTHSDRWTIYQSPDFPPDVDAAIIASYQKIKGKRYDYLGAIMCPIRPTVEIRDAYYCIESVRYMLGIIPYGGKFLPLVKTLYARDWKLIWHEGKAL
jgi:hypothetical protein